MEILSRSLNIFMRYVEVKINLTVKLRHIKCKNFCRFRSLYFPYCNLDYSYSFIHIVKQIGNNKPQGIKVYLAFFTQQHMCKANGLLLILCMFAVLKYSTKDSINNIKGVFYKCTHGTWCETGAITNCWNIFCRDYFRQ